MQTVSCKLENVNKFRKNVWKISLYFFHTFIWLSSTNLKYHINIDFPTRYNKKLKLIDNFYRRPHSGRTLRQNVGDASQFIYIHIFQTSLEAPIGGETLSASVKDTRCPWKITKARDIVDPPPFVAARTPKSLYLRYL